MKARSILIQCLAAVTVLCTAYEVFGAPNPCQPTAGGKLYSFDSVKGVRKEMLLLADDNHEAALLYVSLCEPLSSLSGIDTSCGSQHYGVTNVATVNLGGCVGWGKLPATEWIPFQGDPKLGITGQFSFIPGGGQCPGKRSAQVNLRCGQETSSEAKIDPNIPCHLVIDMIDPVGCPVDDAPAPNVVTVPSNVMPPTMTNEDSEGMGALAILFILAMLAICAYCAIGIVQNVRTEGRAGLDAIPHHEFWLALPTLIVQVVMVVVERVMELIGRGTSGSYQTFDSTIGAEQSSGGPNLNTPGPSLSNLNSDSVTTVL